MNLTKKNIIMKLIINQKSAGHFYKALMAVAVFFAAFSCTDVDEDGLGTASGTPSLDRVSVAEKDSTVTEGRRRGMYVIYGDNLLGAEAVYFNDTEAYLNPTLITNNNIIVRIPEDAPYYDASNELRVVTPNGEATLPFSVAQPEPKIDGFTPLAAGAGEIVTITGSIFEGLESVRFGDIEAEIVSATESEIQVIVPEGVVQSYIFVETAGGESRSTEAFGFKFLIYGDELAPGWWEGGWSGNVTLQSEEEVKRGDYAIKEDYTGGYGGFQIGNGGAAIPLADYQAIKVSIFGGGAVSQVRITINGLQNSDKGVVVQLQEGVWNDFTIPFSEYTALNGGTPFQNLETIVIQEFSGNSGVIYIDDLGLI